MYWAILHAFTDKEDAIDNPQIKRKPILAGTKLNMDPERTPDMVQLEEVRKQIIQQYRDHTAVGNYMDNHDRMRMLGLVNQDISICQNALAFTFFTEGIPIIYYGTEQDFYKGGDPDSRQAMFNNFGTDAKMYDFVKTIVSLRKTFAVSLNLL